MKLKQLFTIQSIVALFNGGCLLLIPALYASVYGVTLSDPGAIFIARLLGAGLLTYCFVAWLARNAEDSAARGAIVLGFFVSLALGFIVSLAAELSGVMNALGWVIVGLYFLLALGYGYFQFMKPDADEPD